MLEPKQIEIRNFFSAGDQPIKFDFNTCRKTLIVGDNGAGKSSMTLDSICFALFGKPYRPLSKPGVVNSINQKNCMVCLDFLSNGVPYRIERGIKPNVLRLFRDGKEVEQPSDARVFQREIEEQVIGFNFSVFKQTSVISAKNFIPFMRLTAQQRRELIEGILELSVLASMKSILLEQHSSLRLEISGIELKRDATEVRIMQLQDDLEKFRGMNRPTDNNQQKTAIAETEQRIEQKTEELNALDRNTEAESATLESEIRELKERRSSLMAKKRNALNTKEFVSNANQCPTCHQSICEEHKSTIIDKAKTAISKVDERVNTIDGLVRAKESALEQINKEQRLIQILESQIDGLKLKLSLQKENMKQEVCNLDELITDRQNQLETAKFESNQFQVEIDALNEKRKVQSAMLAVLKDTGIRAEILRQYIPVINQIINDHLETFGFDAAFVLDENFNEKILSRYRDNFCYENFSAGQQQKIDLALLFAWREIARRRNSACSSVLFLDEVADSSLDHESTIALLQLLDVISQQVCVFLISHKSTKMIEDRFQRVIHFKLTNNFTTMEIHST